MRLNTIKYAGYQSNSPHLGVLSPMASKTCMDCSLFATNYGTNDDFDDFKMASTDPCLGMRLFTIHIRTNVKYFTKNQTGIVGRIVQHTIQRARDQSLPEFLQDRIIGWLRPTNA